MQGIRGRWSLEAGAAWLAAPFVALSLWLGFTVDGFGAWQAGMGVAYGIALAVALVLLSRCGGRFGVTASLCCCLW